MKKFKSCQYIENSLYLAPEEIRACCQRFHYKGKLRGDAVLIKNNSNSDRNISPKKIYEARKNLIDLIQEDKEPACYGCRYINEVEHKPQVSAKTNFISIEHHSFCNLRCNYCSEIYYGGKKPNYNVLSLLEQLGKEGYLQNCEQVVWGGGEPTIEKNFEKLVTDINKTASPRVYHRVWR